MISDEKVDEFETDFFAAPASWRTGSLGRIGTTSYIANGECLNETLATFCTRFREEFEWPHAEVSLVRNRERTSWIPSGPHFDQVDNFIVQATGVKQWRIWSTSTVSAEEKRRRILKLPQYGEVAISPDALDVVQISMGPGDLLYLPLFWGHSVRSLGPGTMLSINLKALTAGQVLLQGMAQHLSELDEDVDPLPLPLEVHDWDAEMDRRMAAAFRQVTDKLAPADSTRSAPCSATVAASGVNSIASTRHQLMLKKPAPSGELRLSKVMVEVADRIASAQLDVGAACQAPSASAMAEVRKTLAIVHIHRFLSLLALGPQQWWPVNAREAWGAARDRIEAVDTDDLIRAGSDDELIELTSRFRDDVLAFNRRHASATLNEWWDRYLVVASVEVPAGIFDDAACTLPADPTASAKVNAALAHADAVRPGFSAAFSTLIPAVIIDPLGRQARRAARYVGRACVHPAWSVEETALALVGALARAVAQVVIRVGAVRPDVPPMDAGGPYTAADDLMRASAHAARAAFRLASGQGAGADADLASGLLAQTAGMTSLGSELVAALGVLAGGGTPDLVPRPLRVVLSELEDIQSADIRELVEGHCWANARFRWSDLRRDGQDDLDIVVNAGLDVSLTPWPVVGELRPA